MPFHYNYPYGYKPASNYMKPIDTKLNTHNYVVPGKPYQAPNFMVNKSIQPNQYVASVNSFNQLVTNSGLPMKYTLG